MSERLPEVLVWGKGSEELGDGADGRPDHRRRVRRGTDGDDARQAPVATPPPLKQDMLHGDGPEEDAAGAPRVAARWPGQGRSDGCRWRHQPATAVRSCSGKPHGPQELAAVRSQQVVRPPEGHAPTAHCHSLPPLVDGGGQRRKLTGFGLSVSSAATGRPAFHKPYFKCAWPNENRNIYSYTKQS